MMSQQNSFAVA